MENFLYHHLEVFRDHLKISFYNNAYSLIALQVSNSLIGFAFWAVVTRKLPTEEVGVGTAIFSAAMLIVSLAGLGFDDGLAYYLSRSRQPNGLINASFCVTASVAGLLSIVFIIGTPIWSSNLTFLRETPFAVAAFTLSVVVLQISAIQDSLFVAERVSKYTLFKGTATNILRILAFLLLLFSGRWAFLFSAVVVLVFGTLIGSNFYQRKQRKDYKFFPALSPSIWTEMIGFSFGNYLTNMVVNLPNTLLPLIVLSQLGAKSNAYFYIAWMVGSMINVIGRSFGTSVFIESSRDPDSIKTNILRSLKSSALIVIPGVLSLSILAHPLLNLLGKDYGVQSTTLVILIAISSIPLTIHGIAVGVLKAKGKVKKLLLVGVSFAALHVGLAMIFSLYWGLLGLGFAIILARTISAFLAFLLAGNLSINRIGLRHSWLQ